MEIRSLEKGVKTACGLAKAVYYDDGMACGIQLMLNDEIVAMLDVIEKNEELGLGAQARVLVYGNGSDEPTHCVNV